MTYEALIFDVNGTTAYTPRWYRKLVVNETLKAIGAPLAGGNIVDQFWFDPNRNDTIKINFEVEPCDFWRIYSGIDTKEGRSWSTIPYSDVGAIKDMRECGFKIGAVTGSPPGIAIVETDIIGKGYFDHVIAAHHSNGFRHKPDPQGVHACLEKLSVSPERAVFIGNGPEDMGAARAAGVRGVLIDRGEYKFKDMTPDIESLYNLMGLLKKDAA